MALPPFPATNPVFRAGASDVFSRAVEQTIVRPRDTVLARRTRILTAGAASGAVS